MPWLERVFWEKKEEVLEVKEKSPLLWRAISYEAARAKYKFNIYWKKTGSTAEYRLALAPPSMMFTLMSGLPQNASFDECRTSKYHAVRLCRDGLAQVGAHIKIDVPK